MQRLHDFADRKAKVGHDIYILHGFNWSTLYNAQISQIALVLGLKML